MLPGFHATFVSLIPRPPCQIFPRQILFHPIKLLTGHGDQSQARILDIKTVVFRFPFSCLDGSLDYSKLSSAPQREPLFREQPVVEKRYKVARELVIQAYGWVRELVVRCWFTHMGIQNKP